MTILIGKDTHIHTSLTESLETEVERMSWKLEQKYKEMKSSRG